MAELLARPFLLEQADVASSDQTSMFYVSCTCHEFNPLMVVIGDCGMYAYMFIKSRLDITGHHGATYALVADHDDDRFFIRHSRGVCVS